MVLLPVRHLGPDGCEQRDRAICVMNHSGDMSWYVPVLFVY